MQLEVNGAQLHHHVISENCIINNNNSNNNNNNNNKLIIMFTYRPKDDQKIKVASHNVAESLKKAQPEDTSSIVITKSNMALSYDVFISYSHQNKAHANKLLDTLRSIDPDLKIFIDTAGLNTGTSWQQLLYNALGKA